MGYLNRSKIIAVIIALLTVSYFVHHKTPTASVQRGKPLAEAIASFASWQPLSAIPIDKEILTSLELDDYLYRAYRRGNETVSLYIGYYFTAGKVGAAHSPLVCFPGQGWSLSDKTNRIITVGNNTVHFAQMVAERRDQKELILYWFQAYDRSSSGTFMQKVNTFRSRFFDGKEDNAFVRITIPVEGEKVSEAALAGEEFIETFYPVFLKFVQD